MSGEELPCSLIDKVRSKVYRTHYMVKKYLTLELGVKNEYGMFATKLELPKHVSQILYRSRVVGGIVIKNLSNENKTQRSFRF